MQRLAEAHSSQQGFPQRPALVEIPMPQIRQLGMPHAPTLKVGNYNGPASLRLKPMSTGLPPMQPDVNPKDSLALSAWAAAGRRNIDDAP